MEFSIILRQTVSVQAYQLHIRNNLPLHAVLGCSPNPTPIFRVQDFLREILKQISIITTYRLQMTRAEHPLAVVARGEIQSKGNLLGSSVS